MKRLASDARRYDSSKKVADGNIEWITIGGKLLATPRAWLVHASFKRQYGIPRMKDILP